ncbi:ABC transporter ATP-binding protein [Methanobacterium sp.]|uniref:ABC transporter ATP-binding protein n=1 Tax=Methanobacterium sp. TaxID=2164 RepID=UPI003158C4CD
MSETILKTVDLSKTYRRGKVDVPALKKASIEIADGEIICLAGPSGSGKSTLLNLLGGVDKPTSGKILINGNDLTKMSENKLSDFRLRNVGLIFQFFNLIPTLTAKENVEFPLVLDNVPKTEKESRAVELLELVGLGHRVDHKPEELSGGEQQRVAIARSLANNPSIIIADEPTGDLDSDTSSKFMDLVEDLNKKRGQTFIISSHDSMIIERVPRVYRIRDGRISN